MEEASFDPSTFSLNRERLLEHDVAKQFFAAIVTQAKKAGLVSSEHFSVDGTLIEAWASLKSFRPKDKDENDRPPPDDKGNPTVDFHGEKRRNETHESTTDPEARLARKGNGKEVKLAFCANGLIEKPERHAAGAERHARVCCTTTCPGSAESPWAVTRATTRRTSSRTASC